MPDLRWVDGPFNDHDLIDADGALIAFVSPITAGYRGIVIRRTNDGIDPAAAIADHPSPEAARAWVESEVRGLVSPSPSVEKKET